MSRSIGSVEILQVDVPDYLRRHSTPCSRSSPQRETAIFQKRHDRGSSAPFNSCFANSNSILIYCARARVPLRPGVPSSEFPSSLFLRDRAVQRSWGRASKRPHRAPTWRFAGPAVSHRRWPGQVAKRARLIATRVLRELGVLIFFFKSCAKLRVCARAVESSAACVQGLLRRRRFCSHFFH